MLNSVRNKLHKNTNIIIGLSRYKKQYKEKCETNGFAWCITNVATEYLITFRL